MRRGAAIASRWAHDGVRTRVVTVAPSALVAVKLRRRRSQRQVATRSSSVTAPLGVVSATVSRPSAIVTATPGSEVSRRLM